MDIRTYLKGEKITLSSLAKDLGCSVTTLHGYVSGRRSIPLRIVLRIEKMTEGKVQPSDWLDSQQSQDDAAA